MYTVIVRSHCEIIAKNAVICQWTLKQGKGVVFELIDYFIKRWAKMTMNIAVFLGYFKFC